MTKSDSDAVKIAKACQTNLKFLAKEVLWRHQRQQDWSLIHDDLAKFLRTSGRRKLILMPRGHLKSAIVTKVWSIQQVINNPELRVLIASDVWNNARKFLRSIQKYIAPGTILPMYFGNFVSDHWNQDECTVRQRTQILDAPTWATTGIEKEQTSQHYDLIIADDLVARDNVGTKDQRDKVKTYYSDLLDLLEPTGTLVVIGTRWHQDDLYAELLENEKERPGTWDVFHRTCYTDATRTQAIYPEKYSLAYLAKLRADKGPYEFSAQYLNDPVDAEAADFKASWIRKYDPTSAHPTSLYLTIDPAISLSADADYSAGVVAGMFSDRRIRVVDYFHRRVVPSDLVDQIFETVKKWRLHRVGIETFAFQKTLKYAIQRQQRERGIFFSIDELGKRHTGRGEPVLSKEARIRRLQPYVEQGLVEVRSDMQELVDELLAFPRGKHDDLIDALSYQLDYLVPSVNTSSSKAEGMFQDEDSGKFQYTAGYWLNHFMPKPNKTIYDRIFADLK